MLWTDESNFMLFGSNWQVCERRCTGESLLDEYMVPTVKHGGGSMMVWGCFGGGAVGELKKIEGIMLKTAYHNILQRYAIPTGKELVGKRFVLMQDNDPKHTAYLNKNYLAKLEQRGDRKVMEWPSQSPDLNPIELLWDELDRRRHVRAPSSVSELWTVLSEEWRAISAEYLDKLLNRMPRICKAVIAVRGGYFDESSIRFFPLCVVVCHCL